MRGRRVAAWLWRRVAAGLAVLLIAAALLVGYRLGRPAEPDGDRSADAGQVGQVGQAGQEPRWYTCSMHPSVRLPDPDAKCPICFMDLIPVPEEDGRQSATMLSLSESAAALSRIETAPVARFYPVAEVRLVGKVGYDQTRVSRLTAYFPGRIERLHANVEGMPLAKGQHVAEVYSPAVLAAFEELRQAARSHSHFQSQSQFQDQAQDQAQTQGDPGDQSLGDPALPTARQTLQAARDKLRLLGLSEAQIRSAERAPSASDTVTIEATAGGVVTHVAVREGDWVDAGDPIATVADLDTVWVDLEAYESQLPMLRWGQPVTLTMQALPGQAFEGVVRFIEPQVDDRTRTATVRAVVENADGRLKPGMFARGVVRARLGTDGVVADARAGRTWVCPMHHTQVQHEPGQCAVCGMALVRADSLGLVGGDGSGEPPLVIPRSAVLYTGTRSVVYVQVPDGDRPTYEGRTVVLGPRAGDLYIVREGLREGERVVVNGAFRIDSAMQISAKPSMMSPQGGGAGGGHLHAGHGAAGAGGDRAVGERPGNEAPDAADRVAVPDGFIHALKPVYAAYLDAQEALAGDDLGAFLLAAEDLRSAVGLVQEAGLVGESVSAWRRAALALRLPQGITDIQDARRRFEAMSQAVIELERRFGHMGSRDYVLAYCPMAFDNAGAWWMQRGETIANPYFGAAMLRCGEVRGRFQPRNRSVEAGDLDQPSQPDQPDQPGAQDRPAERDHQEHGRQEHDHG